MSTLNVQFGVHPRLASILSRSFKSSEGALKELINNSWDADASHVSVTLPPPMTNHPIVIEDDGFGMTFAEVKSQYLRIADDRVSRKGKRTNKFNRRVKGSNGIGKFAGLLAADVMMLETWTRGEKTCVTIDRNKILSGGKVRDIRFIDLPIVKNPSDEPNKSGTRVTLLTVNQVLSFPSAEKLRALLVMDYGREENFEITVNKVSIGIADVDGRMYYYSTSLNKIGDVILCYKIADKELPHDGLIIKVRGKKVGKATKFQLEDDEKVPAKLLKRVYGEVAADGLQPYVTGNFAGLIEESDAYITLQGWVRQHIKASLSEVYAKAMALAVARSKLAIERALMTQPEHRRPIIRRRVESFIGKAYWDVPERIPSVVSMLVKALESGDHYSIVAEIDKIPDSDIARLAALLKEFGLMDLAQIAKHASERFKFLEQLEKITSHPQTSERTIHELIASNLWVFGSDYALLASNERLDKLCDRALNTKYAGSKPAHRPDLLLCAVYRKRYLLVEFKAPDKTLDRQAEAQVADYRDQIRTLADPIHVILLGGKRNAAKDQSYSFPDMDVMTYAELINNARSEIEWLLQHLRQTVVVPANDAA